MSAAADGWDLTVPDDANELLAELRRHGVSPGQKLRVVPQAGPSPEPVTAPAGPRSHRLGFTGALRGAEPDLSVRTDDHLMKGLGLD